MNRADNETWLTSVHNAIVDDNYDQLAEACNSGIPLDQRFSEYVDPEHAGMTPIALSCALNRINCAQVLFDYGASADFPFAALDTTALMTSSFHGNYEATQLLLKRGADVHAIDKQMSTALGYAFGGTRDADVIQMLIEAGVDVNTKNMLGMSAQLLVAGYGDQNLLTMVLRSGGDISVCNDFGHTALHLCVVGKKDQVQKLKRHGSIDAAQADRTLNRRNLDTALVEWARFHRDCVGNDIPQDKLVEVGKFMMSIGQNLDELRVREHEARGEAHNTSGVLPPEAADDEQTAIKRRVAAILKLRHDRIRDAKDKKRPAFISTLMSCGGGKGGRAAAEMDTGLKPTDRPESVHGAEIVENQDNEMSQLSNRFARCLRVMIDNGAVVDTSERTFGMTPLDMAILNGDVASTAVLTAAGADPKHLVKMFALTDLYRALIRKDHRELKDLLTYDNDIDVDQAFSRFNIQQQNKELIPEEEESDEGLTPLTVAVRQGDAEACKLLLKRGADPGAQGDVGKSPLGEAAATNNRKIAEILLSYQSENSTETFIEDQIPAYRNATALLVATISGSADVVDFLIRKGAYVDCANDVGACALVKAHISDDQQIVDALLKADLDRNFAFKDAQLYHLSYAYLNREREWDSIMDEVKYMAGELKEREANAPPMPSLLPGKPVSQQRKQQQQEDKKPQQQQQASQPEPQKRGQEASPAPRIQNRKQNNRNDASFDDNQNTRTSVATSKGIHGQKPTSQQRDLFAELKDHKHKPPQIEENPQEAAVVPSPERPKTAAPPAPTDFYYVLQADGTYSQQVDEPDSAHYTRQEDGSYAPTEPQVAEYVQLVDGAYYNTNTGDFYAPNPDEQFVQMFEAHPVDGYVQLADGTYMPLVDPAAAPATPAAAPATNTTASSDNNRSREELSFEQLEEKAELDQHQRDLEKEQQDDFERKQSALRQHKLDADAELELKAERERESERSRKAEQEMAKRRAAEEEAEVAAKERQRKADEEIAKQREREQAAQRRADEQHERQREEEEEAEAAQRQRKADEEYERQQQLEYQQQNAQYEQQQQQQQEQVYEEPAAPARTPYKPQIITPADDFVQLDDGSYYNPRTGERCAELPTMQYVQLEDGTYVPMEAEPPAPVTKVFHTSPSSGGAAGSVGDAGYPVKVPPAVPAEPPQQRERKKKRSKKRPQGQPPTEPPTTGSMGSSASSSAATLPVIPPPMSQMEPQSVLQRVNNAPVLAQAEPMFQQQVTPPSGAPAPVTTNIQDHKPLTRPAQFPPPMTSHSAGAKLFAQRTMGHVSGPSSPSKHAPAPVIASKPPPPATKPKPPPVAAKPKFKPTQNVGQDSPVLLHKDVMDARRTDEFTMSSDDGDRFDSSSSSDTSSEESSESTSSGSDSDVIRTDIVKQTMLAREQFITEAPPGGPPPPLPVQSPPQTPNGAPMPLSGAGIAPRMMRPPMARPSGPRSMGPPPTRPQMMMPRAMGPPRVPRPQMMGAAHYDPMSQQPPTATGPVSHGRASIAEMEDIQDIDDVSSEYYEDTHETSVSKETTL